MRSAILHLAFDGLDAREASSEAFQNGSLNVPWHDDLVVQLIAVDDIGAFAALAFAEPGCYLGQAVEITGDRLTAPQIADALSAAVGRPIPHTQISLETLRLNRTGKARLLVQLESTSA